MTIWQKLKLKYPRGSGKEGVNEIYIKIRDSKNGDDNGNNDGMGRITGRIICVHCVSHRIASHRLAVVPYTYKMFEMCVCLLCCWLSYSVAQRQRLGLTELTSFLLFSAPGKFLSESFRLFFVFRCELKRMVIFLFCLCSILNSNLEEAFV